MAYQQGDTITAADYNTFANNVNAVIGTGSGAKGYGLSAISTLSAGATITAAQWNSLLSGLQKAANHQGTTLTNASNTVTTGGNILPLSNLAADITLIDTNADNADASNLSTGQAVSVMIDPKRWLVKTDLVYKTFMSSWSINYNSWKQMKNKILFVKYEDLLNRKKTTLIKIFKFLDELGFKNLKLDMDKLNKVIESSDFSTMQKLEKNEDFKEGVIDQETGKRKTFFRLGPKNDWKQILDNKYKEKIEIVFKKEMTELGYL